MTTLDDSPTLASSAYAVLLAEVATGIILDTTGARWTGKSNRYFCFNRLDEARRFPDEHVIANAAHECIIKNASGDTFEIHRDDVTGLRVISVPLP